VTALLQVHAVSRSFGRVGALAKAASQIGLGKLPGVVRAVDNVSFDLAEGEILGLVGESGSGKSTLGRVVAGLIAASAGTVKVNGNLTGDADPAWRHMQMVFQNPTSSLNPRHRAEQIVGEGAIYHKVVDRKASPGYVSNLLAQVGLPGGLEKRFPHQFSGGQRQRLGIARALAMKPKILICDEAVSALDVSIQAQVLNLLLDLRDSLGVANLFISHNLEVVGRISDRVAVMYFGRIVELGRRADVFGRPAHPYTRALLDNIITIDRGIEHLVPLPGEPPSPFEMPVGCPFQARCSRAESRCREERPVMADIRQGQTAACHFPLT
jgi:peptide/nickel transport system ATP-binding protein